MSWEQTLKNLEEITLQEIEQKIAEHDKEVNQAAQSAMHEIHWVLRYATNPEQAIEKIEEIERKYDETANKGLRNHIIKMQKQRLLEDPEAFKKSLQKIDELAEKFRAEDAAAEKIDKEKDE